MSQDHPECPGMNVYRHPSFRKGDWEGCLNMELPDEEGSTPFSPNRSQNEAYDHDEMRSTNHSEPISSESQESTAASQWLVPTDALKKMIMATAETRRCLSGFEASIAPASSSSGELAATDPHPHRQAHQAAMPLLAAGLKNNSEAGTGMQFSSFNETAETGLTDTQVKLVTNDVVSAAIAALDDSDQHQYQHQRIRRASLESSLDAVTEAFLERSNTRRKLSRPAGIRGSTSQLSSEMSFSDIVDTQTRALLAKRKRRAFSIESECRGFL